MAKTLNISIVLGSSLVGLTLAAQLIQTDGTNFGSLILSGFQEIGQGYYLWEYSDFPDNFRGGVKFYKQSDTSDLLAFVDITIEPEVKSCDLSEIQKSIADLDANIQKSYDLLKNCCSTTDKGILNTQTPRIGTKGSQGKTSDMRFNS